MTKKSERSTTDPEKKESTKWEMEVEVSLTFIESCRSSAYTVKVHMTLVSIYLQIQLLSGHDPFSSFFGDFFGGGGGERDERVPRVRIFSIHLILHKTSNTTLLPSELSQMIFDLLGC